MPRLYVANQGSMGLNKEILIFLVANLLINKAHFRNPCQFKQLVLVDEVIMMMS